MLGAIVALWWGGSAVWAAIAGPVKVIAVTHSARVRTAVMQASSSASMITLQRNLGLRTCPVDAQRKIGVLRKFAYG